MQSRNALRTWLAARTPDQLSELLRQRDLPAAAAYSADSLDSLSRLADHLLSDPSTARALRQLNLADLQMLTAVARLADQHHGPLPPFDAGSPGYGRLPSGGMGGQHVTGPAARAVLRTELLERLAAGDPLVQRAAEECLERLAERALVLPPHGAQLTVPMLLHRQSAELQGLGRPVDWLLSEAFNAAEVHRIAAGLELPGARSRDAAQRAVVALLSDPAQVRAQLAGAPAAALELLELLVSGPPVLPTTCFTAQYGYYAPGRTKFMFRAAGSTEPGVNWLAERGMLVPVGTDLAELPREVGAALRQDGERLPFTAFPPTPAAPVPLPGSTAGEAQAAAASAASRVELLLRAIAVQPLALRKAGGVAVRDTKRLAKAIGVPDPQARLWLDLTANADLIAPLRDEAPRPRGRKPAPEPPARMVPTERYDGWLAASPAERLLPLLATWAVTPEIFSYWPDEGETPVALIAPQDPYAVPLRHALLDVLAGLPEGQGLGPGASSSLHPDTVSELVACAAWHRPAGGIRADDATLERTLATLAEAELLGVVAHGALTPVGHALRALLGSGAHRYFPAVPGAGPELRSHPAVAEAVQVLARALAELLPAPQATARFQADLTAVVTGAASPELTDLLSSCASRESEGHAVVWRITAASVRRALDSGLDAAELLQRLAEASADGLPQPLEYLVKDTARTHGRMRVVRSACCIRSDDEALVLELAKTRSLAKLGLRRIAPTVLVSTAEPDAALAALRAAGYAPVLEAASGTTVVERTASDDRAPNAMPSLAEAEQHRGPGPQSAAELAAVLLRADG